MAAVVVQMHSSSNGFEQKFEEEKLVEPAPAIASQTFPTNKPHANDYVLVDNVPSTYGLVDFSSSDDDFHAATPVGGGGARKDDSTATSSTLPSLNDLDESDYQADFFVSKVAMQGEEEEEEDLYSSQRLATNEEDEDDYQQQHHHHHRQQQQQQRNSSKYGGLENLGNTCYLNSALQMIASLDHFVEAIREKKPKVDESSLRNLLLDIIERLNRGETVRPSDFKQELDNRSPLFVGFRQEDSHEFLTTILDLLDEDYKKTQVQPIMDDENDSFSQTSSSKMPAHECQDDSPTKKQKVEEEEEQQQQQQSPESNLPGIPATGSFMDLQFTDIENLLHGTNNNSNNNNDNMSVSPHEASMERPEPRCKLVGGRMDTNGIALTRYDEDPSLANEPANACKAMTDESGSTQSEKLNPIQDYLTTEVRVCLTCESCKYRRSHTETFFHLSLELGPDCCSVEEGLRKFFAPEQREVKCEKCFYETALQTTEITRLPKAILLHLKRFIVDVSPDYTSISYRKDQSAVSFDATLDFDMEGVLHEFLAPDVSLPPGGDTYAIRSVVNHIGSSASCGHYTADAHRVYDTTTTTCTSSSTTTTRNHANREWTRLNDSFVSKVSAKNAIQDSSQTAYMIMYEVDMAPVEKGCVLV